jgi:hypothetical protein
MLLEGAVTVTPVTALVAVTVIDALVAVKAGLALTVNVPAVPAPVWVSHVRVGVPVTASLLVACAMPVQTVSASSAANARDAWVLKIDESISGPSFFVF